MNKVPSTVSFLVILLLQCLRHTAHCHIWYPDGVRFSGGTNTGQWNGILYQSTGHGVILQNMTLDIDFLPLHAGWPANSECFIVGWAIYAIENHQDIPGIHLKDAAPLGRLPHPSDISDFTKRPLSGNIISEEDQEKYSIKVLYGETTLNRDQNQAWQAHYHLDGPIDMPQGSVIVLAVLPQGVSINKSPPQLTGGLGFAGQFNYKNHRA